MCGCLIFITIDAWFGLLVVGYRLLVIDYWILVTCYWLLITGPEHFKISYWCFIIDSWLVSIDDWWLVIEYWWLIVDYWLPSIGNRLLKWIIIDYRLLMVGNHKWYLYVATEKMAPRLSIGSAWSGGGHLPDGVLHCACKLVDASQLIRPVQVSIMQELLVPDLPRALEFKICHFMLEVLIIWSRHCLRSMPKSSWESCMNFKAFSSSSFWEPATRSSFVSFVRLTRPRMRLQNLQRKVDTFYQSASDFG